MEFVLESMIISVQKYNPKYSVTTAQSTDQHINNVKMLLLFLH